MGTKELLTLSQLNHMVRETIEEQFPYPLWVVAELSEIKINASGHCYMELIEKKPDSDQPTAKARAVIWAYTFRMLKPYFETTAGRPLAPGLKILVQAEVSFHEIYGFSLNIKDIDPSYTIGEMALKRKEIIERLQREGILEMNKHLPFPLVPQNIAIISSETAAGFQDFVHQLTHNPYGYRFNFVLFPAIMQGAEAEGTLVEALEHIYEKENKFDVVVIIRGGGSQADLGSFDNYRIAQHITQFPLPVITGIGHEKDETVTDLVAYANLKTPTAVAEFILDRVRNFEERVTTTMDQICQQTEEKISGYQYFLEHYTYDLNNLLQSKLVRHIRHLDHIKQKLLYQTDRENQNKKEKLLKYIHDLKQGISIYLQWHQQKTDMYDRSTQTNINQYFTQKDHKLVLYSKSLSYLDPLRVLQRGYSITRLHGNALKDMKNIHPEDIIHTKLFRGEIKSKVIK